MKDPRDTPELTGSFTVVFPGDIRKFAENPFDQDTTFGKPQAISMGNAFDEVERLKAGLEDVVETLESMDLHIDNPLYDRTSRLLED